MKKILLGLVVVLVIGGLTGGAIVLFQKQDAKSPLPEKQATETKKLPSITLKEYTDPSGFTFSYPDDLSVASNETDEATYADVDFTSRDVKGTVKVHVVDSKLKSLDDWITKENSVSGTVKDVKLGNMRAKEIKKDNGISLAALDQGVLFTINTTFKDEKDFWQSVHNSIASTFSFAQPEKQQSGATSGSSDSSSDVIFEGEEVVE